MQEEIEHKTVNLAISTTKLSARTLLRGMQFLLRQHDKHASQGKQSMKRLVRQNRGVTNVEIQKTGMKNKKKACLATKSAQKPVTSCKSSRNTPERANLIFCWCSCSTVSDASQMKRHLS